MDEKDYPPELGSFNILWILDDCFKGTLASVMGQKSIIGYINEYANYAAEKKDYEKAINIFANVMNHFEYRKELQLFLSGTYFYFCIYHFELHNLKPKDISIIEKLHEKVASWGEIDLDPMPPIQELRCEIFCRLGRWKEARTEILASTRKTNLDYYLKNIASHKSIYGFVGDESKELYQSHE